MDSDGSGSDVEGIPGSPTNTTLQRRVRESEDPEEAGAALRSLLRRRTRPPTGLLTELVTARSRPVELRTMAAVELGKHTGPEVQDALVEAVSDRDHAVVRRAAEALGRIGDEDAHAKLRRLRPRDPSVKESVDFARTLLSYRLGLDGDLLDAPRPEEVPTRRRGAQMDVDIDRADDAVVERAFEDARRAVPGIELGRPGALSMRCDGDDFVAAFTEQVTAAESLQWLGDRSAVLMTVLRRPAVLDEYGVHMYVLTHPDDDGRLRLFVTRSTGVVVLTGAVRLDERRATITLESLPTPYLVPVSVEAVYDHEQQEIELVTLSVDADFVPGEKGSRVPTRSPAPEPPSA